MSDFPKHNGSFNPNAYRSQAAYDAHLKASRVANAAHKSSIAFKPNNDHHQVRVNTESHKAGNAPAFNRNGYRADTRVVNNDFPKPRNAFNPNGYRSQAANGASNNTFRGKKQFQKRYNGQATQKAGTPSSNETDNTHEPHFMSDAEVRQWFAEAEADYERDKKVRNFMLLSRSAYIRQ